MKTIHRKKTIAGMIVWFSFTLALVALCAALLLKQDWAVNLSSEVMLAIVIITLVIPFFSFFWTAHHLTVGKGQPNALMIFGVFGPFAQLVMLAVLMSLPDRFAQKVTRTIPKKFKSSAERIFHYRSKALPRVLFGFVGIVFAIYLWLFSGLWFADPDHQLVAVMFIFILAYSAVINGCYYWVKAKGWNDAVVFIGFLPLVVLFIPWVRLIFVVIPMLFPVSMVMITFILLIVVAALPDKSGMLKRRSFDISKIKESESLSD